MWLSIMTPMMASSPFSICSASVDATLGWFLWSFSELPWLQSTMSRGRSPDFSRAALAAAMLSAS
jgi:hypothetical protein